MDPQFVLALDQGTTSSRAVLYDRSCTAVAIAQREFEQIYPQPGLVEHDAEAIWQTQRDVAADVLARAGIGPDAVAAIGIANQRETVVLWERRSGRAIANAIVWQDRRTEPMCRQLVRDGHAERIAARTGLVVDPYFSATKIRWLLDHVDCARAAADRGELCVGTIDSWLLFRLTDGEVHATDASNASRTMLFSLHDGDWDEEMLRLFSIPRALLPRVVDSSGIAARVAPGSPIAGVPIAGIAGDQQAALFGQGCRRAGTAKNTYGTGCFLLLHTGDRPVASQNRLLSTVAWRIGGRTQYALEGGVFVGGAVVQWLRDELLLVRSARECDEFAARVEDSGGVVLVPAFAGLSAPHWDANARGAVFGLTRGSKKEHLCRAALEGVALQVGDLVEAMQRDTGRTLAELRVDGGASRSDLLLRIQADVLGVPVVRPGDVESTARGAAQLAGLATGFFVEREGDESPIAGHRTEPGTAVRDVPELRRRWQRAVAATRAFAAG